MLPIKIPIPRLSISPGREKDGRCQPKTDIDSEPFPCLLRSPPSPPNNWVGCLTCGIRGFVCKGRKVGSVGRQIPTPACPCTWGSHLATEGWAVVPSPSPGNPYPHSHLFFQGPPSSCHGEPQFPISFSELCTVTLVERSKDCSLVERLEDSVVLYQELRGLLLGREECLLKLFQLEEWGSRRVSLRRGKGSGVTTMSLLPHLSTTHLSL